MNGIDVSNWQNGIDILKVPCDFVISKATQGVNYVNPDCDRVVQQCISLGKPWGVYHYVDGSGAIKEADYFIDNCKGYIGHGILAIDWENNQNAASGNESYLDTLVKRVIERTGVRPLIYSSLSMFPWSVANRNNCGAWVAQYADNNPTGYQSHPWNEGKYTCVIRQYSSNGHLDGYPNPLDLNKAYINKEQWSKYANPRGSKSATPATPVAKPPTINQMARDVIAGKYGDGQDRVRNLGHNWNAVQNRVNQLYAMARKAIRGDYGNGQARRQALGADYDTVQKLVNQLMK